MNKGRREALLAFMDIVEDSAYANLRMKELHCGEDERSFVSAWIYTSLEHIGWADYMLAHYVKRQKRVVRNIFRMAVSELFFMSTPAYAAVNEAVELTHSMGKGASASLINAVLRRMLREKDSLPALPKEPAERLHVQYSMPLWILREWIERFGIRKAEALLSPYASLYGDTGTISIYHGSVKVSLSSGDPREMHPRLSFTFIRMYTC